MTVRIGSDIQDPPDHAAEPSMIPAQIPGPGIAAMPGLGWSQAVELPRGDVQATTPADVRRAWIHNADVTQVLSVFRAARAGRRPPASPWWLRALAAGTLHSRAAGFAVEDAVAALLSQRNGWVYVPWAQDGESGFWEYSPSEHADAGRPNPTTVLHTDRHAGWIDVLPAHGDTPPTPVAVAGTAELRGRIEEFETIR